MPKLFKGKFVKCAVCGKEVKRYRRSLQRNKNFYCSNKCSAISRVKFLDISELTNFEKGYLLGIIDGEGHISSYKNRRWRLNVDNTNWNLINWLGWRFGGNAYPAKSKLSKKVYFRWQIPLTGAKGLLDLIHQKSIIKRDKAKEALKYAIR